MKARHPASLSSLLSGEEGLSALLQRAAVLDSITRDLRRQLPAEVAEHFWIANIRDRTVVVSADSPGWATRIRYLRREILDLLRSRQGLELRDVRVRVIVPAAPARPAGEPRRPRMSSASARSLEQLAEAEPDPDLSDALRRLARRAR